MKIENCQINCDETLKIAKSTVIKHWKLPNQLWWNIENYQINFDKTVKIAKSSVM